MSASPAEPWPHDASATAVAVSGSRNAEARDDGRPRLAHSHEAQDAGPR